MDFVDLMAGKRTEKPAENRLDDGAGVCRGKSVGGERENDRRQSRAGDQERIQEGVNGTR